MEKFVEQHGGNVKGVLSGFDRLVFRCFLSSEIPGFRRVDVPEKTVGNSRVLPFGHFIGLCGCF